MNISDKINLLKTELNSLNKELEKSRSGFETSQKFMSIVGSPDISKPEIYKTWKNAVKEYLSNELEFLRTQVEMIRKISPETADYISNDIKRYEESARRLMEGFGEMNTKKLAPEQFITKFGLTFIELLASYTKLHDMIKMCRNCIHDTLKRLE